MKKFRKRTYSLLLLFAATLQVTLLKAAPSSDESLQKLVEGNRRYMRDQLVHADNTAERRASLASKQEPFAIILSCSDSRVVPEIIFDQNIGDLFVVRVAGNVAGSIERDSIDYAALYLGSSVLLVLGHENCGAVKAVLEGNTKDIAAIASQIEPALQGISPTQKDALKSAVIANVKQVISQLSTTPVLSKLIKNESLKIVGGFYDFLSGEVQLLGPFNDKSKK